MSRIVFSTVKDFEKWVSAFILAPRRYVAYLTSSGEIILKPIVNPRDNDYVYFHPVAEELQKVVNFLDARPVVVFRVKDYEWRIDQGIGVRTGPPEDS